jgi:hypothetical protein
MMLTFKHTIDIVNQSANRRKSSRDEFRIGRVRMKQQLELANCQHVDPASPKRDQTPNRADPLDLVFALFPVPLLPRLVIFARYLDTIVDNQTRPNDFADGHGERFGLNKLGRVRPRLVDQDAIENVRRRIEDELECEYVNEAVWSVRAKVATKMVS